MVSVAVIRVLQLAVVQTRLQKLMNLT